MQLGPFPRGTPYSATDPELMRWVHATLVYSSLAAYELFVAPLTHQERERYHREMNLVARLFGTPADALPSSYCDFQAYFHAEVQSDKITVTERARQIADVILAAPLPAPLRLLAPAHRLATARILPASLRRQYDLDWTTLHDLALPLAGAYVRHTTAPILRLAERVHRPKLAA
ncbi:MAG TPA: oxygenase MpaB family protein [Gaiellaceae bacterium]|nr:oxygenase MpaB family protein [Gaiellaceae bacterium]